MTALRPAMTRANAFIRADFLEKYPDVGVTISGRSSDFGDGFDAANHQKFRAGIVLLNNQATDRLTDDLLKPAWPFGLGSCPKVNHDAADRVPEGAQRIWSRAHGATGLDPERTSSNISDFYCAERQPPWLWWRARRQGVRKTNTFQLGAKDSAGIQMRGVNNGYARNRRPYNSFR
jgi:hypothetical protein